MTVTPSRVQDAFPTIFDLRATHTALLAKQRQGASLGDLAGDVREFVRRAQITGAILDADEQRDAAQGLIDYWVTSLYRASVPVDEDATLVDFDAALAPALDDSLCPYVGLNSFREEDSKRFFGRRHMVETALGRIRELGFAAVVGPSGSGKSSIVLGGVLPALKDGAVEGSASWRYLPSIVPGSNPLKNLADAFGDPAVAKKLLGSNDALVKLAGDATLVVTIDQFEELFTLCDDLAAREAVANNLVSLVERDHVVILTMRSDYESRLATNAALQQLFEKGDLRATPLTAAELREAIEEPARLVGLKFESGVVDALIRDVLGEPAALPLLQFTLWKLWQSRDRNRITLAAYRKLGGGRAALATSATALYESLIQQDRDTMRRILLRMVRPAAGAEVTSSRVRASDLLRIGDDPQRVQRVLDKLVAERLVRYTGEEQVEVAHEALIRNWPLLVSWLEHTRAEMIELRRYESLAEEWERFGRASGFLDEEQLRDAQRWLQREGAADLTVSEALTALVDESARTIAKRKRSDRRARIIAVTVLVGIAIAIAWALIEREAFKAQAQLEAERAVSKQLKEQYEALLREKKQKEQFAADAIRAEIDRLEAERQLAAQKTRATQAVEAAEEANKLIQRQAPPLLEAVVPFDDETVAPRGDESAGLRSRQRPLRPGVSIGNEFGTASSACCLVQDASGARSLLVLGIVLGKSSDAVVLQPAEPDGGTREKDAIGSVRKVVDNGTLVALNRDVEFQSDLRPRAASSVRPGQTIRLIGRGPGILSGKAKNVSPNFFIADVPAEAASTASVGAIVVNQRNELVGYVWSASKEGVVVHPIGPVLRALNVTLVR